MKRPYGLGVVRNRPDGKWEARVTWQDAGKRVYRSTICKKRKDAELALVKLRAKYAPGAVDRTEDVMFDAFMRSWLAANEARWAPGTYRTQSIYVEHHILSEHSILRRLKLRDVSVNDVDGFMRHMQSDGAGAQTRASVLRALTSALGYAVKKGRLAANPAVNADKPKVPKPSGRTTLTLDQARTLLHVAKDKPLGSLIVFLLDTGCRLGEAFAVSWDDVNLTDSPGWVNIRHSISRDLKNRSIR